MLNKKIFYVINDINFFFTHRKEIAQEMHSLGFEVNIIGNEIENSEIKKKYPNFKFFNFKLNRKSINIFNNFKSLYSLYNILKNQKLHIIHFITLKPIIYGLILSNIIKPNKMIFSVSGLGTLFSYNRSLKKKFIGFFISLLLKILLINKNVTFIVQNSRDYDFINSKLSKKSKLYLIKGSGVDLNKFKPKQIFSTKISILMASRIILEKGVLEYIDCANHLKNNKNIKFLLCGKIDVGNPSYLSKKHLLNLCIRNNVEYLGEIEDMAKILEKINISVLASYYGEGIPKFLLESASSGKPIITTNIPGCKDTVINYYNGILVPPRNPLALSEAITKLVKNQNMLHEMGNNSRHHAQKNFDIKDVVRKHIKMYT